MKYFKLFLIPIFAFLISKGTGQTRQQVEQAMNKYNRFIISMNTDSIASAFTLNGHLGNMARGQDSIKYFLNRFREFKVLSQNSTTSVITITGNSAVHKGRYWQTTVVPPTDTIHLKGFFNVKWLWIGKKGWKIERIDTQSEHKTN